MEAPTRTFRTWGSDRLHLRPSRPGVPGAAWLAWTETSGQDRGVAVNRANPERGPTHTRAAGLSSWSRYSAQEQAPRIRPRHWPSAGRPKAVNRNAKRLLVYVLDVAATLAQNQVVVDLARRQRKTTGEWGPLRPWYYAPHAAHVKYDPEDRLILALLDEAQGTSFMRCIQPRLQVRDQLLESERLTGRAQQRVCGQGPMAQRHRHEPPPSDRYAVCAALCFGRTRRRWSSALQEQDDCVFAAPTVRTIHRQYAGMTDNLGGFR